MGSKLNTPNRRFIIINDGRKRKLIVVITGIAIKVNKYKIRDDAVARMKLDIGPAIDMIAASRRGFFRLNGSNCTGFPHPNPMRRRNNVPYKSR